MIKNYFKTAWRSLWKNKTFSAINIFGLSVGIAAFLLIINYLRFEYSYDDAHVKKDRIYRVPMMTKEKGGKEQTFAFTYPAVAPALKKDFPEIEEAARFRRQGGIVTYKDQKIVEGGTLYYADASLFNIFSFRFIKGNAATAFKELNDAVITEETAKKYFGNEDPIGKPLHYRNEDYVVKGVLEDVPANSHIRFNILLNYDKYIQLNSPANTSWGWSDFYTYVLLKPGTNAKALEAKLPAFTEKYMGADMKQRDYQNFFYLQPLKDIHVKSKYDYEMAGNGDLSYLKYLGIAALFILFIAWINYVNLSTAHSLDRSKEVGIRKVVGAGKFQLIRQFLIESLFINIIAILIGILIYRLTLSSFASFVEKDISYLNITDWRFWVFVIGLFLLGALLAAFYPAFVLSSFQPIYSIKTSQGASGLKGGRNFLRKSLVVLQFIAAIVLITGAIGFYRQLKYMQDRDLGVNIQQTLVVQQTANTDSTMIPSFNAFINDMKANSAVKSVTASTSVPGGEIGGSSGYYLKNSLSGKRCRNLGVDKDFIPAYGLSVVAGRNFTNDHPAVDTNILVNILLNETAVNIFGFQKNEDAIGQYIDDGSGFHYKVIGVVKDWHQESLANSFDPVVFYPEEERNFGNFSLKFNTTNLPAFMDFVKQKWSFYYPQSPFRFVFLDERFNAQYKNDQLFATVLWLFTAIAITIACLGLFGLSLFTIAKRNKEISIRKVLGATLFQITSMITKDYLKLVLLAGIVALPVAYILVNNWLHDYAFHVSIGIWFFILPILMIITIAVLTVLYQSLKAGITNPVKNLRSE